MIPLAAGRLAVLILALAVSGALPLAAACLEAAHGCGETCARCICRNRPAPVGLRAPCPCCQPRPLAAGPAAQLLPAILPERSAAIAIDPALDPVRLFHAGAIAHTRPVPHPPPRAVAA